jgi:type IV secretion system protein VirB8
MENSSANSGMPAEYFRAARTWEADKEFRREQSERRAWTVAATASAIAVVAVIGLSTLAPFRRNVPYLFALDKATGNVEFVGTLDDRTVKGYQELLDKHWAQRYVVARESYFYKLLQEDYDTVLALSAEDIARDYARIYEGPNARDVKFGANVEMKVAVISIQLARNSVGNQAVVRFSKTVRRQDANNSDPTQYYVATIAYEYKPHMFGKEKDLLANPLGFAVTSYRTDPELAPVEGADTKNPGPG